MKLIVFLLLYFSVNVNAIESTQMVIKILETYINEILNSAGDESECAQQLRLFVDGIKTTEIWAMQMLDASAKINPGIVTGNLVQIGFFDECLEINKIYNGSHIEGQYCRSTITPTETANDCIKQNFNKKGILGLGKTTLDDLKNLLSIKWDICVPAVCTAAEIQDIWNFIEDRYELKFHLFFVDRLCSTVDKINYYSPLNIAAIAVFVVIGAIIVMSTLYDVLVFQKCKDKEYNLFMAFSYYTNGKRLFTIKDNDDTKITCLHGIRVISIVWIIVGHHYIINFLGAAVNYAYMAKWIKHKENMFIAGSLASVDTFFVISGFLIIYLIMLAKEKGLEVNLIVFYVHRILRLTPALAALILVFVGILPHLGSGPYWNYVDSIMIQPCVKYWWSTLTFTQTYLHPKEMCMIPTWYLSVDTHLYLLSPLIFLPLQRWPKPTIAFVIGLMFVSIGFAVHATYYYELSQSSVRALFKYYEKIYNPTHTRMGPWLVGVLLGYFMFKTRNKKFIIKKRYIYLSWALCITVMLLILHLCLEFLTMNFTLFEAAMFNGVIRIIWGVCISWVIFACARGFGGYINKFLSLSIFNILSRLTFAMYLTHGLIISVVQGQRRTTPYAHNLFNFYEFWGDFAFTVGLSFLWTMTFESPVSILESVIIKRALKKNEESKEETHFSKHL